MKFRSDHSRILAKPAQAFARATVDTLVEAQRVAPHVTGKYRASLQLSEATIQGDRMVVRLGSPLAGAKAKEQGAYIQAKRAPWLAIPHGDGTIRKVKAVRIPARPTVTRAGPKFPEFMTRRLRELG